MRALVVTVAGTSSRFSESTGEPTLKCIYHEGDPSRTLIGRILRQAGRAFDRIVVVGGFMFDELEEHLASLLSAALVEKVQLVRNDHFADRGSGWSLFEGLKALQGEPLEAVVFVEGDLSMADESMAALCSRSGDAITCTDSPVEARSSVALYEDAEGHPRYAYDTAHGLLKVGEPFRWIRSSGQAWRFGDPERLFAVMGELPESAHAGTNLELVGAYFSPLQMSDVELICLQGWLNCNTVQDYRRAFAGEE